MSDLHDGPPSPSSDGYRMSEVQKSLGRIEGLTEQILERFNEHARDDRDTFELLHKRISDLKTEQDAKIAALKAEQDTAKGAGKVILALLAAAASFAGAAVIAVWSGWLSVKFK